MKKILFIGMTPVPGGIESFILNVFLRLKNKYKFEFINTSSKDIAYSQLIRKNGGVIIHIPIKNNIFKYFNRYVSAYKFFKIHHNYDIIDLNSPTINRIFWLKAALDNGINNLIIHSHNCSSNESFIHNMFSYPLSHFNKLYLKNHKNIIKLAASTSCGKWMFDSNNFKVINNGINTEPFMHNKIIRKRLRKYLGITNKNKVVITTARLEKQKNYRKIINVFYNIHKINNKSKLVIIGDGSEKDLIKKWVNNLNLISDVYFLGKKTAKEIPKLLNIADMMLMPSLYEAVPFSLTEAQAAGIPALVSAGAIPKEANITGEVTYLSLKQSDKRWGLIASKILNRPYNINQKVAMNIKVRNSNFNVNKSVKLIDNIYSKLIQG